MEAILKIFKFVLGLLHTTRPHIVLSILFTPAATAFLAAQGFPPLYGSCLGILVMIFAVASAHTFNDYCDRDIDALNPRTRNRAIIIKWVSPGAALVFALFCLGASLGFAFLINTTCLILMAVGGAMNLLYSLYLKRTRLGFLPPAIAAFLLPMGAWCAFRPSEILHPVPLINATLGFCFELVPYWCQTIMDVDADRDRGVYTIPVYYGYRLTAWAMFVMFLLSLFLLLGLFMVTRLGSVYCLTVIVFGIPLLVGYWKFLRHRTIGHLPLLFALSMAYIVLLSVVMMGEMAAGEIIAGLREFMNMKFVLTGKLLLIAGGAILGTVLLTSIFIGTLTGGLTTLALYFVSLRAQEENLGLPGFARRLKKLLQKGLLPSDTRESSGDTT